MRPPTPEVMDFDALLKDQLTEAVSPTVRGRPDRPGGPLGATSWRWTTWGGPGEEVSWFSTPWACTLMVKRSGSPPRPASYISACARPLEDAVRSGGRTPSPACPAAVSWTSSPWCGKLPDPGALPGQRLYLFPPTSYKPEGDTKLVAGPGLGLRLRLRPQRPQPLPYQADGGRDCPGLAADEGPRDPSGGEGGSRYPPPAGDGDPAQQRSQCSWRLRPALPGEL